MKMLSIVVIKFRNTSRETVLQTVDIGWELFAAIIMTSLDDYSRIFDRVNIRRIA